MCSAVISVFSTIVFFLIIFVFVFTLIMMFSPKVRGMFMSRQIKSIKYMTDYSKNDIESINTNVKGAVIKSKKKIIDNNYDDLQEIVKSSADISKDAIKTTVEAIRESMVDRIYCKWCGAIIDEDSKFCKVCGKKQ